MIGTRGDMHLSHRRELKCGGSSSPPRIATLTTAATTGSSLSNPSKMSNDDNSLSALPFYYRFCQPKKQRGLGFLIVFLKMNTRKRIIGGGAVLLFLLYLFLLWSPKYYADPCEVARQTQFKLAQLKALGGRTPVPAVPDWKPEIPKIIHHQWKDANIPPKYQEWHSKWFVFFPEPEYAHMHWTDEAGRQLIVDHYPFFLDTFDKYDYHIKRVDAVRYFALHKYGGIHADLDFEPMLNFYSYLPPDRVSVVESPYQYYEVTQNSLMSSPRADPFWLQVFEALEKSKHLNVMEATGPKLLDRVFASSPEIMGNVVHVLPCENYQRIPLGETHVAPFLARFHKELFARLYPMKNCGRFDDTSEDSCQFTRHHCSASYLEDTGIWDLLWK